MAVMNIENIDESGEVVKFSFGQFVNPELCNYY